MLHHVEREIVNAEPSGDTQLLGLSPRALSGRNECEGGDCDEREPTKKFHWALPHRVCASTSTKTPISASLSQPSTEVQMRSTVASLSTRRVSFVNLATTSLSLANFCSLPRGASTVSSYRVPSVR